MWNNQTIKSNEGAGKMLKFLQQLRRPQQLPPSRPVGKHVLQEIIDVTDADAWNARRWITNQLVLFTATDLLRCLQTIINTFKKRVKTLRRLLTQEVGHHGVPEQQRASRQHPGQQRRPEAQQAEDGDGRQRVSFTPDVHQHDHEGLTEEEDVGEQSQQLQTSRLNRNKNASTWMFYMVFVN